MTWAALERQHALVEAITKDLVAARRRCGLTQAQLSEISDVAPWHVSETESSYIILDPNRLDRLCSLEKAFAIDLRWRDRLHELIQSSQDDHHYRIGQEVRAWRRRHKLHRTPAADRLGIQVPNLLSIEDGDLPDEALIPALSVAVGIDLGRERIAYRDPWGTTQGASTGAPRAITDHEHTGPVQGAETGAPQDTNREEEPMPGERQHDEPTWLAESVRIGARVQEARHGAGAVPVGAGGDGRPLGGRRGGGRDRPRAGPAVRLRGAREVHGVHPGGPGCSTAPGPNFVS